MTPRMSRLLPGLAPYVLAVAVGGGWLLSHNAKQRALGAAAIRDSINAARIDSLTGASARRDTLYVTDTLTRWRTVRTTETLIDTLLRSDTVVLTRRESVIVFAADSAIQACRSIVLGCEARVAARDSLLSALTDDRDRWKGRARPSFTTQTVHDAKVIAAWELLKVILKGVIK
jgi:hypothetical protein